MTWIYRKNKFIKLSNLYFWKLGENANLQNIYEDFPGGPVAETSPSNAGGVGSIPSRGAKIPHALGPKNQNIKQKQYYNKFSKRLKRKYIYIYKWN